MFILFTQGSIVLPTPGNRMRPCSRTNSNTWANVMRLNFLWWLWTVYILKCADRCPLFSCVATRKKLFEIARTFSEKTKRKKSKRRTLLKHHSYPSSRIIWTCFIIINNINIQAQHHLGPGVCRGQGGSWCPSCIRLDMTLLFLISVCKYISAIIM